MRLLLPSKKGRTINAAFTRTSTKRESESCGAFTAILISRIQLKKTAGTIRAEWSDDYPYQVGPDGHFAGDTDRQKLTAISPSSEFVAVGTTDDSVSLLTFPSLETAAPTISLESELVDLDWGGAQGEWVSTACKVLDAILTLALRYNNKIAPTVPSLDKRWQDSAGPEANHLSTEH